MNETPTKTRDYSETLFLPKTDFPMRAGLPQKEPEMLARWQKLDLYGRLRAAAQGPAANSSSTTGRPMPTATSISGTALNKILKDVVTAASRCSASIPITCRAGTATACRSNGRSRRNIAPRARTRTRCRVDRIPPRVPRLRRALDRRAARGVQAARRRRRLGAPLHDHGASRPRRRSRAS